MTNALNEEKLAQPFIPADGPHGGPPLNSNVGRWAHARQNIRRRNSDLPWDFLSGAVVPRGDNRRNISQQAGVRFRAFAPAEEVLDRDDYLQHDVACLHYDGGVAIRSLVAQPGNPADAATERPHR